MSFYHMGRCGKCGRPLTVPQSIQMGIGPICLSIPTKVNPNYKHNLKVA